MVANHWPSSSPETLHSCRQNRHRSSHCHRPLSVVIRDCRPVESEKNDLNEEGRRKSKPRRKPFARVSCLRFNSKSQSQWSLAKVDEATAQSGNPDKAQPPTTLNPHPRPPQREKHPNTTHLHPRPHATHASACNKKSFGALVVS